MTGRWAAVLRAQITHLCAHQDWRSLAPANVQAGLCAFLLSFFITQRDADRQLSAASPVWRSLSAEVCVDPAGQRRGRSLAGSCTEYARPTRQMSASTVRIAPRKTSLARVSAD
jgi:hypothetical protein